MRYANFKRADGTINEQDLMDLNSAVKRITSELLIDGFDMDDCTEYIVRKVRAYLATIDH
jgi:hypothetical protein